MHRKASLLTALTALFAAPLALAQPESLTYVANFDQYAAASWARGTRTSPAPTPARLLVEGRFGKALSLPSGQSLAIVADDGNFRADQGTIQMWLRPNWSGNDGRVHLLVGSRAEAKNYMNLNVLADGALGAATGSAGKGVYKRVDFDTGHWEAGDWHHLAFTWGDGRLALFVDGAKIGETDEAIPLKREPPVITIGPTLDGAIDELAVWSVPLQAIDISGPIQAPDMGEPPMPDFGIPPVGEIDRYHYELPAGPSGCVVTNKHYVDEIDPNGPPPEVPTATNLSSFAARDEWQTLGLVVHATRDLSQVEVSA